jgi:hypothetical protein
MSNEQLVDFVRKPRLRPASRLTIFDIEGRRSTIDRGFRSWDFPMGVLTRRVLRAGDGRFYVTFVDPTPGVVSDDDLRQVARSWVAGRG